MTIDTRAANCISLHPTQLRLIPIGTNEWQRRKRDDAAARRGAGSKDRLSTVVRSLGSLGVREGDGKTELVSVILLLLLVFKDSKLKLKPGQISTAC